MFHHTLEVSEHGHGVVSGARPDGKSETLVVLGGKFICPLEGGHDFEPFRLSPFRRLRLRCKNNAGNEVDLRLADKLVDAVYDPFSKSYYISQFSNLWRLDSNRRVSVFPGSFDCICGLAVDGQGALYVADTLQIHRVDVALWQSRDGGQQQQQGNDPANGSPQAASDAAGFIKAMDGGGPCELQEHWNALAYDARTHSLVAATSDEVYRLPIIGDSLGPRWLLAKPSESESVMEGVFIHEVNSILARPDGTFIIQYHKHLLFLMDTWGGLDFIGPIPDLDTMNSMAFVEPLGCLAVLGYRGNKNVMVLLGGPSFSSPSTKPSATAIPLGVPGLQQSSAGASPSTSPPQHQQQLSAQLQRPQTGAATMDILVGGTLTFTAHRSLLASSSDYFKQLLSSSFTESATSELELPDADPDAFSALLGFLYTGSLLLPDALLRPAAELAGRLLMHRAVSELSKRLVAATTPATLVSDLLWAERHQLRELVAALKDLLIRNYKQAMQAAPEAAKQLAEGGSPALMAELLSGLAE